jgi:hypothetical protein
MTPGSYAPHETRMLSLESAIDFVGQDKNPRAKYSSEDVIAIARKFQAYLCETPLGDYHAVYEPRTIEGFAGEQDEAEVDEDAGEKRA